MEVYDALIIGGGASGLMCAIAAKRKKPRLRVAVLEKNDRVGKKLLATGNGRCTMQAPSDGRVRRCLTASAPQSCLRISGCSGF